MPHVFDPSSPVAGNEMVRQSTKVRASMKPHATHRMTCTRRAMSMSSADASGFSESEVLNPVKSIDALPNEILLLVFGLFLARGFLTRPADCWCHGFLPQRPLAVIEGVCRRWRECLIAAPSLWQSLRVVCSPEWLELGLVRSKNLPVDLAFCGPDLFLPSALLLANIHRIRTLVLCRADVRASEVLDTLLASPMHALEQLRIGAEEDTGADCRWYGRHFSNHPKLRTIRLHNVRLDWAAGSALRHLRSIDLTDTVEWRTGGPRIPFATMMRGLAACTNLEDLFIQGTVCAWNVADLMGDSGDRAPTVPLSRLRSLTIDCPSYGMEPDVYCFLAHVQVPVTAHVHIEANIAFDDDDDAPVVESFVHYIPNDDTCLPILRAATSASVGSSNFFCWVDGGGSLSCQLHYEYPCSESDDSSHMSGFRQLFSRALLKSLTIQSPMYPPIESWLRTFEAFPTLTTLRIESETHDEELLEPFQGADMVLAALMQGDKILPNLRALHILNMDWDEDLLDTLCEALSTRAERGLYPLTNLCMEMSLRAESEMEEMAKHQHAMDRLRTLVDGCISWRCRLEAMGLPVRADVPRLCTK
ncbi:hypothetical protein BN946_scf185033.g21 [Trametes cinnabarina]|uniref:F-box domain-containing protein n=1 Tax=Pycnoporus cinnabarinus TaxID=5643 RepID=A0A060SX98_PYCCI|nr:hypothetical protein BN946_scf185033.g21 [Trametes cinnabarina]